VTWILLALLAHDPITTKITWDAEISRIVNRRCISCHAAGSSVDLSTYELARPWAKAIRNQVLQRSMPPWGAVKGFGEFRRDSRYRSDRSLGDIAGRFDRTSSVDPRQAIQLEAALCVPRTGFATRGRKAPSHRRARRG